MSSFRVALSLVIVATLPLASGCGTAAATPTLVVPAPARQSVRTAPVEREAIAPPIRATGMLIAREQASLSFKVGGVIDKIMVQPGDTVRPGQVLAKLDTREIDAQLRQAEVALQKAQRDEQRFGTLYTSQATPRQAVDDAASAARLAEQALEIARFNRDHAVIVAQGSGRVARRLAEPNNVVGPGTPVLQLNVSSSGYVVRAGLIDRDIVRVALREKADVTFDAFPGRRFEGTVIELAEEPSPLSGVYDVQIRLDSPPPRLISGLVAKLELKAPAPERLAVVPLESLVEGDGRAASVYVIGRDGKAQRRRVETAFVLDGKVAVRAGLDGVARVVSEGAAFLSDGAAVEVKP
jgi:multidrug efflux system membrane fusion protein